MKLSPEAAAAVIEIIEKEIDELRNVQGTAGKRQRLEQIVDTLRRQQNDTREANEKAELVRRMTGLAADLKQKAERYGLGTISRKAHENAAYSIRTYIRLNFEKESES